MKLFWTLDAVQDRRTIYDYIEAENPIAALALDELFSDQADLLLTNPYLGKTGRVSGTRELVVHKHYILVYDIKEQDVRVLRVLHSALLWP